MFKSMWEKFVANALTKERLEYAYEQQCFSLNTTIRYTPDFFLEAFIKNRKIILEPHGIMDPLHFRKFALFRRLYGEKFYLILIVKNDLIPCIPRDAYDDIWPIEFVSLLTKRLREQATIPQRQNHTSTNFLGDKGYHD